MAQDQPVRPETQEATITGPLFIVIEGADGVGKTTLADRLVEHLGDVVRLREPTNQKWGAAIREAAGNDNRPRPGVELSWFMLDRMENVRWNVLPALAAGRVVVQDRYYYSTAAYQGVYGGIDSAFIVDLHRAWAPEPDLLVILTCDAEAAADRIKSRGKADAFEKVPFQQRVNQEFQVIGHRHTGNVVMIDTRSHSADQVFEHVIRSVRHAAERKKDA